MQLLIKAKANQNLTYLESMQSGKLYVNKLKNTGFLCRLLVKKKAGNLNFMAIPSTEMSLNEKRYSHIHKGNKLAKGKCKLKYFLCAFLARNTTEEFLK